MSKQTYADKMQTLDEIDDIIEMYRKGATNDEVLRKYNYKSWNSIYAKINTWGGKYNKKTGFICDTDYQRQMLKEQYESKSNSSIECKANKLLKNLIKYAKNKIIWIKPDNGEGYNNLLYLQAFEAIKLTAITPYSKHTRLKVEILKEAI